MEPNNCVIMGHSHEIHASHVVTGHGTKYWSIVEENVMILADWLAPKKRIYEVDGQTLDASKTKTSFYHDMGGTGFNINHCNHDGVLWMERIRGSDLTVVIL